MDDSLEHPDDGLRDRIRKGFESNVNWRSKKIAERPKTPRRINKGNVKKVTISKKDVEIVVDDKKEGTTEKKPRKTPVKHMTKSITIKAAVRKPKSVVPDIMKQKKQSLKSSTKKTTENTITNMYLCPKCDKSYKSKNGILKHMEKCM